MTPRQASVQTVNGFVPGGKRVADQSIMRSGLDLLAATRSRRYPTPAIRGPAVRWSTTRATAASLRLSTGCPERRRGATPDPLAASHVPPTGRQEGARF